MCRTTISTYANAIDAATTGAVLSALEIMASSA